MTNAQVLFEARALRAKLRERVDLYWARNGTRRHWWQFSRDRLPHEDELLLAQAEWVIAFLIGENR